MYVSTPPQNDLPMSGSSACSGDGSLVISNTQTNVKYQAFMGSSSVSNAMMGTGGNITLAIGSTFLSTGVNTVSVQATAKGCATLTLASNCLIDKVASAPSAPGKPTGPVSACPGETAVSYTHLDVYKRQGL